MMVTSTGFDLSRSFMGAGTSQTNEKTGGVDDSVTQMLAEKPDI